MKVKVGLMSGGTRLEHIAAIFYCEKNSAWLYFSYGESDNFEDKPPPTWKTFLVLDLPDACFEKFYNWVHRSRYVHQYTYSVCGSNCVTALRAALSECGVNVSAPGMRCHVYQCFGCLFPVPMMTPRALYRLLERRGERKIGTDIPVLRSASRKYYAQPLEDVSLGYRTF